MERLSSHPYREAHREPERRRLAGVVVPLLMVALGFLVAKVLPVRPTSSAAMMPLTEVVEVVDGLGACMTASDLATCIALVVADPVKVKVVR